jgi:hypothetical protein
MNRLRVAQAIWLALCVAVFGAMSVWVAGDDPYLLWFTVPAALCMGYCLTLELSDYRKGKWRVSP